MLKTVLVIAEQKSSGREFQMEGQVTENAVSPNFIILLGLI